MTQSQKTRQTPKMTGFFLINKPKGPTSHDIVNEVRKITGERRVGHAGTLDPFATGLLIIGMGREATKEMGKLLGLDKQYLAVLYLGATSNTDDSSGLITSNPLVKPLGLLEINKALKKYIGDIEQVPPLFSAKKIKGQRLYKLTREGKYVKPKKIKVHIYSIKLISYKWPYLQIQVHCSSGTYIRSLGRDIGETLGVGAYLKALKRLKIGPFILKRAVSLKQLKENYPQHLQKKEEFLRRINVYLKKIS